MKVKSLVLAAAIAVSGVSAFAGQAVNFVGDVASFSFTPSVGAFVKEFDFFGLPSGNYDTFGSFSAQNVFFTSVTLDGTPWQAVLNLGKFSFGATLASGSAPAHVVFTGFAAKGAAVSGELTVTAAVPEPETYAMLLAGLGVVATIARRRKQA